MRFVAAMLLVLRVLVARAQPRVDAALPQPTCELTTVSFANVRHGWVADCCGAIFESRDAGRTWQKIDAFRRGLVTGKDRWLTQFVWSSTTGGVALVANAAQAYRTTDAGATWLSVPMPVRQSIRDVERVDTRIWACGYHGVVLSDDDGETWREVVGPASEPVHCSSLSFIDARTGWVSARNGELYETEDGGASWHERTSSRSTEPDVVRASEKLGWIVADGRVLRTIDDGTSFTRREDSAVQPRSIFVTRLGERFIFSSNRSSAREELVPLAKRGLSPWGADGVVAIEGNALSFYRDGVRLRTATVDARAGVSVREALLGTAPGRLGSFHGWSAQHVYASLDGKSWSVIGDLPAGTRRAGYLDQEQLVAETASGWYRGVLDGRAWRPSTSPAWDAYELDTVNGQPAVDPMTCVTSAEAVTLDVDVGAHHKSILMSTLSLERVADRVTLKGYIDVRVPEPPVAGSKPATRASIVRTSDVNAFVAIASRIVDAAARADVPSRCWTSMYTFARVTWACDGAEPRTAEFGTSDCEARLSHDEGAAKTGNLVPGTYARAIGIGDIAREALTNATSP